MQIKNDGDVTEPHTEIVGSPNIYLEEGATLNLTCLVTRIMRIINTMIMIMMVTRIMIIINAMMRFFLLRIQR